MDLHLGGKIAVVTGSSKGIAWAITWALVDEGATVVAGARSSGPDLPALETDGRVVCARRPHHDGRTNRVDRSCRRPRRGRHFDQ
jgi:NAD(P)-dependent dehydrogenase (short-subunit alcohol dehydrogenase family)